MITWDSVTTWLVHHGIKILIILIIGIILWYLIRRLIPPLVNRTVEKAKGESKKGLEKRTNTLVGVLIGISRVIIVIVVLLMILTEVGVPIGPMLAGFGIAGVAVGFGAQYLVRDLIAGIFILWENQYRIGDVAKVTDVIGTVEDVTLRKTVLRDVDGIVHHVPNGEIRVASNYTRHFSRVNLDISVSYDTDLDYAMEVIDRIGEEIFADGKWHDRLITPPKSIRVNKLGDSGIDIKVMCDVKPSEQWATMGEIRLRLKKAFDAEGIEIPWPHTKVYFGNSMEDVTDKK
ncbi:MAG TPA: mechanosensitive ion channel family protein [Dehalococcoidia bacterium]|nr:mechanosensitive ion channel family protein [Dehalococcoidia bacterium]